MACKQAAMSWIFNGAGLFWNYLCWWKCSLVSHRKKYPIPQTLHVSRYRHFLERELQAIEALFFFAVEGLKGAKKTKRAKRKTN